MRVAFGSTTELDHYIFQERRRETSEPPEKRSDRGRSTLSLVLKYRLGKVEIRGDHQAAIKRQRIDGLRKIQFLSHGFLRP